MADKLTVAAYIQAKEGKAEQVKQELAALMPPTHAEPGCISYVLHQSKDDPHLFLYFENWTSKEALDEHIAKPHVQAFLAKADDLLTEPIGVTMWEEV